MIKICCGGVAVLLLVGCAPAGHRTDAADAVVVNSLRMELVRIPAGSFTMGAQPSLAQLRQIYPWAEPERLQALQDESPAHEVRITRPFYMARHELTIGQYREFVARSGHVSESEADGTGAYGYNPAYDPATTTRGDAFEGRNPRYSWRDAGFPQSDAHPVVNLTWNDAQALARWLSAEEGRVYRLPTEAEWEYACRGPAHPAPASLNGQANVFDADSARLWPQWNAFAFPFSDGFAFTAPVGSFEPNGFGLHDMVGNVWEWTADWYAPGFYAASPHDDPQGPRQGEVRVRRGGSWHTWPLYARCTFRNWNTPETRYTLVGIRLVLEAR